MTSTQHDLETLGEFGTARDLFNKVRVAVPSIERLNAIVADGIDGITQGGSGVGHASGVADPTAARAAFLIEKAPQILHHYEKLLERDTALVGAALHLLHGVELALGEPYRDAVELHYIDQLSWEHAAEHLDCSRATAIRMRDVAFDYIDSAGWSAAIRGEQL